MSFIRRLKRRCSRKKTFEDEPNMDLYPTMRSYKCVICDKYHLTKSPFNEKLFYKLERKLDKVRNGN